MHAFVRNYPTGGLDRLGLANECTLGDAFTAPAYETCGIFGCGVRSVNQCFRCVWSPAPVGQSQTTWKEVERMEGTCVIFWKTPPNDAKPCPTKKRYGPKCHVAVSNPTQANCMDCCDEMFGGLSLVPDTPAQFVEECFNLCYMKFPTTPQ